MPQVGEVGVPLYWYKLPVWDLRVVLHSLRKRPTEKDNRAGTATANARVGSAKIGHRCAASK